MYASFNLKRELKNELEYAGVQNPTYHPHFHSHIEIYMIRSGKVEVLLNNERRVLGAGEISIAFGYDTHGYRTVADAKADYLIIPISVCNEFLPLLTNRHARSHFLSDPETYRTVEGAFDRLHEQGTNELLQRGYVYVILGAILEKLSRSDSPLQQPTPSGFSAEILIYVSNHFREKLTLSTVAKHFGYHPSYFSRNFQQTFGISFVQYLTMLRLREVVLLLQKETKNVTECAFECGFGSMRSFYRAFADEFGCTPKEYWQAVGRKV